MNEPTLHPNLARIAAAYDHIIEQLQRGAINHVTAREQIAQLEARDDQGVRWAIDPDSGNWTRKTTFGDVDFDSTPPTYGYLTHDAFDMTSDPRRYNPGSRVSLAEVDESVLHPAGSLLGATRRQSTNAVKENRIGDVLRSPVVKFAGIAVVLVVAVFAFTHRTDDATPPNQQPAQEAPAAVPAPAPAP